MSEFLGTSSFWYKWIPLINTAFKQLGCADFFLTLSNPDISGALINRFMESDKTPYMNQAINVHITSQTFQYQHDKILDFLYDFFDLKYYISRSEFQGRGSLHAHLLLKLMNGPKVGKHSGLMALGQLCVLGFHAQKKLKNRGQFINVVEKL